MKRDIQQVLDECVESMLNGTATLEECVSRLGNEMRAEVEPMLFAVKRVTDDADVKPNEIKKQSGKTVFLAAVEQKRWESGVERKVLLEKKVGKDPYVLLKRLAVLMVVVIALSGATIAMASESLPGNMLYPVKRAVENARINLTPEGGNKRLLYMQAAENRMDELEKLEKDNTNYAVVMQDMAESLEKATGGIDDQDNAGSGQNVLQPRIQEQLGERLAAMQQRSEKNIAKKLNKFAPGLKPLIEKELARLGKLKNKSNVAGTEENFLPANSQAGKAGKKAGDLPGGLVNAIDNAAAGNKVQGNNGLKPIGGVKNSATSADQNKNSVSAARTRETNGNTKDLTGAKVKQLNGNDNTNKTIIKRKIKNNRDARGNNNSNISNTTTTTIVTDLNNNSTRKKKNNTPVNTIKPGGKAGTDKTIIDANNNGSTQPAINNQGTNQNTSANSGSVQSDTPSGNPSGSSNGSASTSNGSSQKTDSPSATDKAKP